jgi:MFS family permease
MSMLHAWACAGGLAGVALSSAMAALKITPLLHYAMLALPCALLLKCGTGLLATDSTEQITQKSFVIPRGGLALLGALGFLCAIAEGSIANWSGIFMKDHFGVSDGFAPLSLVAFSIMMLVSRMMGDRLKNHHGAKVLVTAGALTAAVGLFFNVYAPNPYFALAGFAVAGIGLSLVFPFVFSAAGREGPVALAGVATMTYSGTLMGPPMLGAIAHGIGIEAAMGFIGLLAIVIAVVAARTRLLN